MVDQTEELDIHPLENDEIIRPEDLPRISRLSASYTYNFLMAGMVARLYLYLFGDFEKDVIAEIVKKITEHRTVINLIIDEKKPPLRTIYDYLIELKIIEDQNLSVEAMLFIDAPDALQSRIKSEEEEQLEEEVEEEQQQQREEEEDDDSNELHSNRNNSDPDKGEDMNMSENVDNDVSKSGYNSTSNSESEGDAGDETLSKSHSNYKTKFRAQFGQSNNQEEDQKDELRAKNRLLAT